MHIADLLSMSSRSVHEALKRGAAGRLYDRNRRAVNVSALEEALLHGVRYFMPAEMGSMTRGVATAWAAPPLSELLASTDEPPPVWPHPEGSVRGIALLPLHSSVPRAVEGDKELYELLALTDALRADRAREAALAAEELRKRLRRS